MFFSRWKNLSIPSQECQKIFKASGTMENNDAVKAKLLGYGFQVRTLLWLMLILSTLVLLPVAGEH